MTYVYFHHNGDNSKQQQWWPDDGNDRGNNNSSGVGKWDTCNSKYFEINLHTTAMTIVITVPAVEVAALL
jgi:hypothetical protein